MKKLKLHELEKLQLNENGMRNAKGGEPTVGPKYQVIDECFGYGTWSNAKMTAGVIILIPEPDPKPDPGPGPFIATFE